MILDGVVYGATNALDACRDSTTFEVYGDNSPSNGLAMAYCAQQHGQDCMCVRNSDSDCYVFNLDSADNCGQIMTKLPSLLLAAVLFELILVGTVFAYSVCTCKTLCCASAEDQAAMNGAPNSSHGGNAAPPVPATAVAVPSKV
jgi:hypothetical protein